MQTAALSPSLTAPPPSPPITVLNIPPADGFVGYQPRHNTPSLIEAALPPPYRPRPHVLGYEWPATWPAPYRVGVAIGVGVAVSIGATCIGLGVATLIAVRAH